MSADRGDPAKCAFLGLSPDAKRFWTRIGVAFENRDGSWNLRFDYFRTNPATTVQMRDIDSREERDGERRERAREE